MGEVTVLGQNAAAEQEQKNWKLGGNQGRTVWSQGKKQIAQLDL